ncbi:MAG TPA: ABC transporter substrate-binding protein [bacterium]|nr:ABC transporter substrate-binding protein [bacterium]
MTHLFVRRLLPLLLAAAIVPVGFWGVGLAQAQAPKTLVIAIGADQTGLDPQTVENNESGFVMSTIFDSIVNYKPGSSDVGPGLAESWTISPDGKVYTFHIRHNVNFQDGTPMNARTVAQDVDRAINPNNPCYVLARKDVDTYDDFTFGSVKDGTVAKMDVLDDYTLRFTLPQPNAPFITSLAMVWQGIMSPAATKQYNCDASQHPVGTGPFKFVEAVRNDHITLDANAAYWGGRPKVDRLIFQIVPESATRMLQLERNQVQVLADVPPSDYSRVTGNKDLKLYSAPGLTILGVGMSNDLGPFKDVRVRQAMNYAVDKDAINKGLYGGATTASQGMPPVLWGYNKSVDPYPYDPAKAKQLLTEAGFASGFTTEMIVYANPRGYNPIGGAKLGEAVQGYLAKVGVNVKITQYEWGAYLDKYRHTPWEGFAISGWSGDNGDPDNFLGDLFEWDEVAGKARANNASRHHDVAYDKLIVQGRQVTDQAKRAAIYEQANKLLHDDAAWIFINHTNQVRATRTNVTGFQLNPLQMFFHMEQVGLQ